MMLQKGEGLVKERQLRDKQDIDVNGRKYFISSIPATKSQKMLFSAIGAFQSFLSSGSLESFPTGLLQELNSYAGTYNDSGAAVQFVDDDVTDMMIQNPLDLYEVQLALLEKNFGFFGGGKLTSIIGRLTKILAPAGGKDISAA